MLQRFRIVKCDVYKLMLLTLAYQMQCAYLIDGLEFILLRRLQLSEPLTTCSIPNRVLRVTNRVISLYILTKKLYYSNKHLKTILKNKHQIFQSSNKNNTEW